MLAVKKEIIPPEGGWKERAYYIVDVSFNSCNPIHRKIFFTGFLNGYKTRVDYKKALDGIKDIEPWPGGYNGFGKFGKSEDYAFDIADVYYMKTVYEIPPLDKDYDC